MAQTITAKMPTLEVSAIGTPCLICGETVPIALHIEAPKICEKCKEAVMTLRRNLERDPCEPIMDKESNDG